jgi:hypothetical protein
MPEPQTLIIHFEIPGATEPDDFAVRAYDDERLQDMALMGPDEHGVFDAEFDRNADSLRAAVISALHDLTSVFPEAEVLGIEQDVLVSIAAIARRTGRSHESVRLYARGRRGPGSFPAPAGKLDAKTEVWRWPDVAIWWQEELGTDVPELEDDLFLTMLNDALEIRRTAGHVDMDADALEAIAAALPEELRHAAAEATPA